MHRLQTPSKNRCHCFLHWIGIYEVKYLRVALESLTVWSTSSVPLLKHLLHSSRRSSIVTCPPFGILASTNCHSSVHCLGCSIRCISCYLESHLDCELVLYCEVFQYHMLVSQKSHHEIGKLISGVGNCTFRGYLVSSLSSGSLLRYFLILKRSFPLLLVFGEL